MAQSYPGASGFEAPISVQSSGTTVIRWLENVHLYHLSYGSQVSGDAPTTVVFAGTRNATGAPYYIPHFAWSGSEVELEVVSVPGSGSYPAGMSRVRAWSYHAPGSEKGIDTTFSVISAGSRVPSSFNPYASTVRVGATFAGYQVFESKTATPPRWLTEVHNYAVYGPGKNKGTTFPSLAPSAGTRTPGPSIIPPPKSWTGGRLTVDGNIQNKVWVYSDDESYESLAQFNVYDMSVTPTPPTGMVLWLKSDAGVTKDGSDYVSAWADQSPYGNNATAAGGQRPVWTASKFNGLPGLAFNGGQMMSIAYSATYDTTDFTAYVVVLPGNLSSANGYILSRDNGATRFWEMRQRGDSTSWVFNNEVLGSNNGGDVSMAAVRMDATTFASKIYTVGWDYSSQALNRFRRSWVNGRPRTVTAVSGTLGQGAALGMNIGANAASNYYWTGWLAEVFVYPRLLTQAEHDQMHWYLYTRYRITYDPNNLVKTFKLFNRSDVASQLTTITGVGRLGIQTSLTPPVTQAPNSEQTLTVTIQKTNQGPFSTLADLRYTIPSPSKHGYIYLTGIRPIGTPPSQPTNLVFSRVTGTSMRLTWAEAGDAPSGYIVLRSTSAVTDVPVDDTLYLAGNTIGDAYVAYCGPDVTFLDTGLLPTTLYHYAVFAWNGSVVSGQFKYQTVDPLRGSHETIAISYLSGPDLVDYSSDNFCGTPYEYTACTSGSGICVVYPVGISAPDYLLYSGLCYSLVGVPPTIEGLELVDRADTVPELACDSTECTKYDASGPCYPYLLNGQRVVVEFPRADLGRAKFGAVAKASDTGYSGLNPGQYARPATTIDAQVVTSPGTGTLEFTVGLESFKRRIYRSRSGVRQYWDLPLGTRVVRVALVPGDVVGIDLANEARKLDKNVAGKMLIVSWMPVHTLPAVYDTASVPYAGSTTIRALGFAGLTARSPYSTYAALPYVGVVNQVNPDSIVTVVDAGGHEYLLLAVRALGDVEQQLPQVPLYAGQALTGPFTFKFWAGRSITGQHGEMDVWFDSDQDLPTSLLLDRFRMMTIDPAGYPMQSAAADVSRNCVRINGTRYLSGVYRSEDGQRVVGVIPASHSLPATITQRSTGKTFTFVRTSSVGGAYLTHQIDDGGAFD